MGFYTKYFSTLLKGVRATSWKERIEARRAISKLRKSDRRWKRAYDLLKVHRVTASLREFKNAIPLLNKSLHNADAFIFNVLTEDKALVKAEQGILQALMELSQVTKNNPTLRKFEKELALAVYEGTKKYRYAEQGEREEYRRVEAIVNEAKGNRNKLMANLALMFQKEDTVSFLLRFPMRSGASREKTDILHLQSIATRLRGLTAGFKPSLEKNAEAELRREVQEVAIDIRDAFFNTYDIKKKDILIVLKILYDLHQIKRIITTAIDEHNLPKASSEEFLEQIEKHENAIVQDFQTVAQGFRIVIAVIEKLEKEALTDSERIAA